MMKPKRTLMYCKAILNNYVSIQSSINVEEIQRALNECLHDSTIEVIKIEVSAIHNYVDIQESK